ncbi:MAG: ribbon-helix-helix protein, CopG family [Gammaproteobacteria bacterium]|nr:ribbon-helix-helix protein, CopG family [Gammaproteobacteria bacterium]
MRTTLDIEDDVLAAVKELARREGRSAGDVLSALARRALTGARSESTVQEPRALYGFRPFPAGGKIVTNEQIDDLRDREGI